MCPLPSLGFSWPWLSDGISFPPSSGPQLSCSLPSYHFGPRWDSVLSRKPAAATSASSSLLMIPECPLLPTWSLRLSGPIRHPLLLSSPPARPPLLQSVCRPAHCVRLFSSFLFYSDIPSNVYFKPCCSPLLPFLRPRCITLPTILFGQNFQSLSPYSFSFLFKYVQVSPVFSFKDTLPLRMFPLLSGPPLSSIGRVVQTLPPFPPLSPLLSSPAVWLLLSLCPSPGTLWAPGGSAQVFPESTAEWMWLWSISFR